MKESSIDIEEFEAEESSENITRDNDIEETNSDKKDDANKIEDYGPKVNEIDNGPKAKIDDGSKTKINDGSKAEAIDTKWNEINQMPDGPEKDQKMIEELVKDQNLFTALDSINDKAEMDYQKKAAIHFVNGLHSLEGKELDDDNKEKYIKLKDSLKNGKREKTAVHQEILQRIVSNYVKEVGKLIKESKKLKLDQMKNTCSYRDLLTGISWSQLSTAVMETERLPGRENLKERREASDALMAKLKSDEALKKVTLHLYENRHKLREDPEQEQVMRFTPIMPYINTVYCGVSELKSLEECIKKNEVSVKEYGEWKEKNAKEYEKIVTDYTKMKNQVINGNKQCGLEEQIRDKMGKLVEVIHTLEETGKPNSTQEYSTMMTALRDLKNRIADKPVAEWNVSFLQSAIENAYQVTSYYKSHKLRVGGLINRKGKRGRTRIEQAENAIELLKEMKESMAAMAGVWSKDMDQEKYKNLNDKLTKYELYRNDCADRKRFKDLGRNLMEVGILNKEGEKKKVEEKVQADKINIEKDNIIDTSSQKEKVPVK